MRHPDWKSRLAVLMDRHRSTPFAWGTHDCHTWGVAVLEAVTGERRQFGEPYADVRSAVRELRKFTEGGYRVAVAKALGGPPAADYPKSGDIVLATLGKGRMPAVGVFLGELVAFPGPKGLSFERVERSKMDVWHL